MGNIFIFCLTLTVKKLLESHADGSNVFAKPFYQNNELHVLDQEMRRPFEIFSNRQTKSSDRSQQKEDEGDDRPGAGAVDSVK